MDLGRCVGTFKDSTGLVKVYVVVARVAYSVMGKHEDGTVNFLYAAKSREDARTQLIKRYGGNGSSLNLLQ